MGPRLANSAEAPRFYPRHTKRESNSETRAIPRRRLILSTFVASFANFLVSDTVYVIHSQDVWKRVSFDWLFFSALFDYERGVYNVGLSLSNRVCGQGIRGKGNQLSGRKRRITTVEGSHKGQG
ncbi:hypothetical protein BDV41DRAFT_224697 [Aspergillus transmontanensis]|uniref:Uncharacterized protein n=1 Tax=Aspergillus transmontanensis TaxID=1034304 RepID=A0A5N6W086_9EURO|nr:hypothetical protein BDV41DRAFT_224697 [Aspergillus transmontanensis]